jgi:BolA protein
MKRAKVIETKLKQALSPLRIDVVDESHRHEGHAGAPAGGESHFRIVVVSEAFTGKSRIERQRMVYALLAEELAGGVHALAMTALTPAEDAVRKN